MAACLALSGSGHGGIWELENEHLRWQAELQSGSVIQLTVTDLHSGRRLDLARADILLTLADGTACSVRDVALARADRETAGGIQRLTWEFDLPWGQVTESWILGDGQPWIRHELRARLRQTLPLLHVDSLSFWMPPIGVSQEPSQPFLVDDSFFVALEHPGGWQLLEQDRAVLRHFPGDELSGHWEDWSYVVGVAAGRPLQHAFRGYLQAGREERSPTVLCRVSPEIAVEASQKLAALNLTVDGLLLETPVGVDLVPREPLGWPDPSPLQLGLELPVDLADGSPQSQVQSWHTLSQQLSALNRVARLGHLALHLSLPPTLQPADREARIVAALDRLEQIRQWPHPPSLSLTLDGPFSPWWSWHVTAVGPPGHEPPAAGRAGLTAQDTRLARLLERFPLFPSDAVIGPSTTSLLPAADDDQAFLDGLVWWAARGLRLLQILPPDGQLTRARARSLGQVLRWVKGEPERNDGAYPVLGDPGAGQIYGYYQPGRAVLSLRNPAPLPGQVSWTWAADPAALTPRRQESYVIEWLYPYPRSERLPAGEPVQVDVLPAGVLVLRAHEEDRLPPTVLGPVGRWIRTIGTESYFEVWGDPGEQVQWEICGLPDVSQVEADGAELEWRRRQRRVMGRLMFPEREGRQTDPGEALARLRRLAARADEEQCLEAVVSIPSGYSRAELWAVWEEVKPMPTFRWEADGIPISVQASQMPPWVVYRLPAGPGTTTLRWAQLRRPGSPAKLPQPLLLARTVRPRNRAVLRVQHGPWPAGGPVNALPCPDPGEWRETRLLLPAPG